jgi:hypothetical protein
VVILAAERVSGSARVRPVKLRRVMRCMCF